jgi:hypothetical protein
MTKNSTQLRSFIEPVWQEISSLWSGVDFPYYEPMPDPAMQLEPVLPVRTVGRGRCIAEVSQLLAQR